MHRRGSRSATEPQAGARCHAGVGQGKPRAPCRNQDGTVPEALTAAAPVSRANRLNGDYRTAIFREYGIPHDQ